MTTDRAAGKDEIRGCNTENCILNVLFSMLGSRYTYDHYIVLYIFYV